MTTVFRFGNGVLELLALDGRLSEQRAVGVGDVNRFADWAASYLTGEEAELLMLGRALYAWLDGGERWLDRLLAATDPPLIIEFRTLLNPDPPSRAFLQVPWELLANEAGFLAADVGLDGPN